MRQITPGAALRITRRTPLISGQVDGMAGAYVSGWAIALPDMRPCSIEITNENGQVVASGTACLPRPDLVVLGHARMDFAFRVPVSDLDRHTLLTVTADGEELPGSPLQVGPGVFDGHMTVSNGYLTAGYPNGRRHFCRRP